MNKIEENSPAALAAKCINQTNKPVFLTGKAGTGKTTFLRSIIQQTHKNAIIVAPTGIAAINAGGVTIHSQFGLPFGLFVPDPAYTIDTLNVKINTPRTMVKHLNMREPKRRLLQELELLVIDEVSMLRADLLDTIDFVLRAVRRQQGKAFGGVQVLFIGDLMQLPPVIKDDEWRILRQYYKSIYFFDAQVLKDEQPVYIELDTIYRQSDRQFISLLNNLRNNEINEDDVELLNQYYKPNFDATKALNTITLTTHNRKADDINKNSLDSLDGRIFNFDATIEGDFPESGYPLERTLTLKEGAQIMFVKNDISGKQLYFNGKIGVVKQLKWDGIQIDFNDGTPAFWVEKHSWKNVKYELNELSREIEENEVGEFIQFPIKLAWAITVHKSQGLTFEHAILDVNKAFAPGQIYVALSRLTSLDGLILTAPIRFNFIAQDDVLITYSDSKPKSSAIKAIINQETSIYLKEYLLKAYGFASLYATAKFHAESYNSGEKSNKQKHHHWAVTQFQTIEPLRQHADNFCKQIHQLFEEGLPPNMAFVEERSQAARNYFYPVLLQVSKAVLEHIANLKEEKSVKGYLEELQSLEAAVYKQLMLIEKSNLLIHCIRHNKEFDKQQLHKGSDQAARIEAVRATLSLLRLEEKKTTEKSDKTDWRYTQKKIKAAKQDTKEISYNLYKEGKTITEIAADRDMVYSTIEKHLLHYVSLGLIPAWELMPKEKYDAIIAEYKKHGGSSAATPIREALGDNYSYSEIRIALATQKHLRKEES